LLIDVVVVSVDKECEQMEEVHVQVYFIQGTPAATRSSHYS